MAARARMIRMWRAGFEMRWGLRRDDFFSKVQGGRGDEEELPSVPGAVGLRRTEGCASALLAFGSVITPPGRFSKSGVGIALLWFGESGGQMSLGLPSMLTATVAPHRWHRLMVPKRSLKSCGQARQSTEPSASDNGGLGFSFVAVVLIVSAFLRRGCASVFSWTSESKSRPEHFHSLMEWTAGREKLGMIRSVPPSGRRGAAWGCSFLDLSV